VSNIKIIKEQIKIVIKMMDEFFKPQLKRYRLIKDRISGELTLHLGSGRGSYIGFWYKILIQRL
jgi:hypothetical protein